MQRPKLEIQTEWEGDLDEIFGRHLMYFEALDPATGPRLLTSTNEAGLDSDGYQECQDLFETLEREP